MLCFKKRNKGDIMNKKGELPWWLILLVLGLLFLAIMSFAGGGIMKKAFKSMGLIQDQTSSSSDCLTIFDKSVDRDGDGWRDDKEGCDAFPDDASRHKPEESA